MEVRKIGESKPLGVTATHPVGAWIASGWVAVGELRIGERIWAKMAASGGVGQPPQTTEPVYNVEVEGDHCYRVGEQGFLVHNQSLYNPFGSRQAV